MAIIKWTVKELLTAIKMNNFTNRRASDSEQVAVIDAERSEGDQYHNTDKKTLQIYQSGSGATFKKTELSNFIFRSDARIGIGASEKTIYDEEINNQEGISNTRIIVTLDYLAEISLAGNVKVIVTDGSSPVEVDHTFSSNPSPVTVFDRFDVDTTSFAIDDILNIQVLGTNVNIDHVEMRCV